MSFTEEELKIAQQLCAYDSYPRGAVEYEIAFDAMIDKLLDDITSIDLLKYIWNNAKVDYVVYAASKRYEDLSNQ